MTRAVLRGGMAAAVIAVLALGGCATRESRVEGALVKAGVPARLATCLAPRLADRLSNDQLRALAQAARRPEGDTGKASLSDILARISGTGDPAIVQTVTAAGLHCALKG